MSKTIFLRVGTRDTVALADLVTSLNSFLRLLRDFDATISKRPGGTQVWEVTKITQNSPIIIGVTPEPKRRMQDFSEAIEAQLLDSSNALTMRQERTPEMSDSALLGIKQLAGLSRRIGTSSIYIPENGQPKRESPISEATMRVVNELTSVRFEAYGTISGALEAISVHAKRDEFRIWDEATGKPVRCKYHGLDIEARILASLRKKVYVSGVISSNGAGYPISVAVEDVENTPENEALPSVHQMAGFIKDYMGGRRMKDYLKETDDE